MQFLLPRKVKGTFTYKDNIINCILLRLTDILLPDVGRRQEAATNAETSNTIQLYSTSDTYLSTALSTLSRGEKLTDRFKCFAACL